VTAVFSFHEKNAGMGFSETPQSGGARHTVLLRQRKQTRARGDNPRVLQKARPRQQEFGSCAATEIFKLVIRVISLANPPCIDSSFEISFLILILN
jgi:hypothetical protein